MRYFPYHHNKNKYILLIFIMIVLSLTSCKKENVWEFDLKELSHYSFDKYDLLPTFESTNLDIKNNNFDVFLIENDLIFIAMEGYLNNSPHMSQFGPSIIHEKIIICNYKTKKIENIIEFKEDIYCYDLIISEDSEIFISYKAVGKDVKEDSTDMVEYYIGKIINDDIKVLEEYNGFIYKPSKFNKLSSNIYYTYQKEINNKIISGIRKINGNEISNIIEFDNIKYLDTRLFTNGNSLMSVVEDNFSACIYIVEDNKLTDKIYFEPHEKILAYNILKDGVIVSYQNSDTDDSEIVFIDFVNHHRRVIKSIDMYNIISNGLDDCLAIDPFFDVHYIKVGNEEIIKEKLKGINSLKISDTNVLRLFKKSKNDYGIFIEDEYLYLDIKVN